MFNVGKMKLKKFSDEYGSLVPIEETRDIPFEIKRVYYIFDVEEAVRRGFHSHNKLHQVLICVNGSVKILVQNGEEKEIHELNNPSEGLYIGPKVWREMYDFSDHAVLLVLASDYFDEADYVRNYDTYLSQVNNFY